MYLLLALYTYSMNLGKLTILSCIERDFLFSKVKHLLAAILLTIYFKY